LLRRGKKKEKVKKESVKAEPAPPKVPAKIIEVRPVYPPYAHVSIAKDERGRYLYEVIEPSLEGEERENIRRLKEILAEELDISVGEIGSHDEREEFLRDKIKGIIKRYKIKLSPEAADKLIYYLIRDFVYLGKIEYFMRDHMVEDVSCDGPRIPIYVWHRQYESMPTNVAFESADELDKFVVRLAYLAGKHVSVAQPIVDGSLPDGSRLNAAFGKEVTKGGSSFTIRKFTADPLTIIDLIAFNTISPEIGAYLWFLVENRASILVSGGVASGKTTFLNSIAMFIRPELKLVTIEDTAELNIPHENIIQSLTRSGFGAAGEASEITLFDLLKNAMRQRPDYIIVGEIRGQEAYTLIQAVATGHGGFSTIHGDSVQSVIYRLESEPMNIPRNLVTSIDAIVVLGKVKVGDRSVRRMMNFTEIISIDSRTRELLTSTTYSWIPKTDSFIHEARSPFIRNILASKDLTESQVAEDLEKRAKILKWMVSQNIRRYLDVAKIVRQYYIEPERPHLKALYGLEA
jgi:flagellar protein FlaI